MHIHIYLSKTVLQGYVCMGINMMNSNTPVHSLLRWLMLLAGVSRLMFRFMMSSEQSRHFTVSSSRGSLKKDWTTSLYVIQQHIHQHIDYVVLLFIPRSHTYAQYKLETFLHLDVSCSKELLISFWTTKHIICISALLQWLENRWCLWWVLTALHGWFYLLTISFFNLEIHASFSLFQFYGIIIQSLCLVSTV